MRNFFLSKISLIQLEFFCDILVKNALTTPIYPQKKLISGNLNMRKTFR